MVVDRRLNGHDINVALGQIAAKEQILGISQFEGALP